MNKSYIQGLKNRLKNKANTFLEYLETLHILFVENIGMVVDKVYRNKIFKILTSLFIVSFSIFFPLVMLEENDIITLNDTLKAFTSFLAIILFVSFFIFTPIYIFVAIYALIYSILNFKKAYSERLLKAIDVLHSRIGEIVQNDKHVIRLISKRMRRHT